MRHTDLDIPPFRSQWDRWATLLTFYVVDFAIFRIFWHNRHSVLPKDHPDASLMIRSNQPSPWRLAQEAKRGIKTVISLRGGHRHAFLRLEHDACERLGLKLIHFGFHSRRVPERESILAVKDLFEQIEYPALFHCKSGADRAGLMAVLYLHFQHQIPITQAREQLSGRYGHIKAGPTGILDHFFETYLAAERETGLSFIEWVTHHYSPETVAANFQPTGWGTFMVDRLLRRE